MSNIGEIGFRTRGIFRNIVFPCYIKISRNVFLKNLAKFLSGTVYGIFVLQWVSTPLALAYHILTHSIYVSKKGVSNFCQRRDNFLKCGSTENR